MVETQPLKLHSCRSNNGFTPSSKINSVIVPCTNTPYIFVYGGFDDNDSLDSNVYLLNTDTMQWDVDNTTPYLYRDGHSGVYIGNGNVLIFGGLLEEEIPVDQRPNYRDSLLIIYNIFDRKWIGPPEFALKNAPSKRARHACCLSNDGLKVFISGGIHKSQTYNDLYCYYLTTGLWEGPIEFVYRFYHTIIHYNDRIYSFSGLDQDMNHVKTIQIHSLKNQRLVEISLSYSNLITSNDIMILESNLDDRLCLLLTKAKNKVIVESFNLETFETQYLMDESSITELIGATFKFQCGDVCVKQQGKIYALGNSRVAHPDVTDSDDEDIFDDDNSMQLSHALELDLEHFGIANQESNLSTDFLNFFKLQQYTDFEIACLSDENERLNYENSQSYETKSLYVHKSILLARWPHFQRMIASEMNESLQSKMFIPEPYQQMSYLLYFLYTDKLDSSVKLDISDYSALLLSSNLYEIKKLKCLIIDTLFDLFHQFKALFHDENEEDITVLLTLWRNLLIANESVLICQVLECIKLNWAGITKSKSFATLSKQDIVKLCQDAAEKQQQSSNNSAVDVIGTPVRHTSSPFLIDSPVMK